jgi:phosphoribosylglycinamide formyltransferase 1
MQMNKKRLAIFASGAGSNAQKIIEHFANHSSIEVALIVCNKPNAGVLAIAVKANIAALLIEKNQFANGDGYVPALKNNAIDFLILAGFLWKVPSVLVNAFPNKILNIHPALLPKFGGKGMYGHFVHEAVLANHEKESGISIHKVNVHYDEGDIVFQAKCVVDEKETPESLATKIHALEHRYFATVIEEYVNEAVVY